MLCFPKSFCQVHTGTVKLTKISGVKRLKTVLKKLFTVSISFGRKAFTTSYAYPRFVQDYWHIIKFKITTTCRPSVYYNFLIHYHPLFYYYFNNWQSDVLHFMYSPFPPSLLRFTFCIENHRVCFVIKQRITKSLSSAFLPTESLLFKLTEQEMALKIRSHTHTQKIRIKSINS